MGCGASSNNPPVQPLPADTVQPATHVKKDSNVGNKKQQNSPINKTNSFSQKNTTDTKTNLQTSSTSKLNTSKSPQKKQTGQ